MVHVRVEVEHVDTEAGAWNSVFFCQMAGALSAFLARLSAHFYLIRSAMAPGST